MNVLQKADSLMRELVSAKPVTISPHQNNLESMKTEREKLVGTMPIKLKKELPKRLKKYMHTLVEPVHIYHWSNNSFEAAASSGVMPQVQTRKGIGVDRQGYANELGNGWYFFQEPLQGARYVSEQTGGHILKAILKPGTQVFVIPEYKNTGSQSGLNENSAMLMLGDDYADWEKTCNEGFHTYGIDLLVAPEFELVYDAKTESLNGRVGQVYVNLQESSAVTGFEVNSPTILSELKEQISLERQHIAIAPTLDRLEKHVRENKKVGLPFKGKSLSFKEYYAKYTAEMTKNYHSHGGIQHLS